MYGILAACIAVMALFLGLFAISVEPVPQQDQLALGGGQTAEVRQTEDRR